MEQLKDRLKNVREFRGKSQKDMAKDLEVSVTALQNYESGVQYPGGKILENLCRLGFDVNWLLTGEGNLLRCEQAERPNLKEIGGEPVPQPAAEYLDKRLLTLTFAKLKPVFDEYHINDPHHQAGVITDVYSVMIERHLDRNLETVEKIANDMRSVFSTVPLLNKFSSFGPNLFNIISKMVKK